VTSPDLGDGVLEGEFVGEGIGVTVGEGGTLVGDGGWVVIVGC